MIGRRTFLFGLGATAPAVILTPGLLMPVRSFSDPYTATRHFEMALRLLAGQNVPLKAARELLAYAHFEEGMRMRAIEIFRAASPQEGLIA